MTTQEEEAMRQSATCDNASEVSWNARDEAGYEPLPDEGEDETHPDDAALSAPDAKPVFYWVAVYHRQQCFGGREEGGWWYDAGELCTDPHYYPPHASPSCHLTEEEAIAARTALELAMEAAGINDGLYEYTSVLSTGRYYAEIHEGSLPTHYPETRPHYE
jgi:hypothetical protein